MDVKDKLVIAEHLDANILHIRLNRPEQLNTLNQALLFQLQGLFEQAKNDSSVRAVLLTGEGKGFSAGADIKELEPLNAQTGSAFARTGQMVFRDLQLLGKPSLAAIHGYALGGGCELAMAATLRLAANNAVFGQPEVKLGVLPGFGGTQRLSRLIGKGRALEICLTGRRFSAEEAWQWGLVNEICTPENLISRSKTLLTELTKLSPTALQNILIVINQGYDLTLDEGLELEAAHFGICCAMEDKREGVKAFLEKRIPVFKGE